MTITLDNQTFPVRASMRAWREFENKTGQKVSQLDGQDVVLMPELLYYFVKEGCRRQNMQFKMSVDDFLGLIDVGDLPAVMQVIEESMAPQKKTEQETETKSHLNGMK